MLPEVKWFKNIWAVDHYWAKTGISDGTDAGCDRFIKHTRLSFLGIFLRLSLTTFCIIEKYNTD